MQKLYKQLEEFMREEIYPREKEVLQERFDEKRWQVHPMMEELKVTLFICCLNDRRVYL